MIPQELKIVISRGSFQGVSLKFFMTIFSLALLMTALVLIRDSSKNKTKEKSKPFSDIFQILIVIVAIGIAVFVKMSSRVDLVNSSSEERIATGSVWEVQKVRKEILQSFKETEQEKSEKKNGENNEKPKKEKK